MPMSMTAQLSSEEVARGLTKAQRRVVLAGYFAQAAGGNARGFWSVRDALDAKGLLPLNGPLATAVRQHLIEQEKGG